MKIAKRYNPNGAMHDMTLSELKKWRTYLINRAGNTAEINTRIRATSEQMLFCDLEWYMITGLIGSVQKEILSRKSETTLN